MERIDYRKITPEQKKGQMDAMWRRRERQLLRIETIVRKAPGGLIRPAYKLQPQMLVKDENGRWCPELKIHGGNAL
jgi:hypothetical protein